MTNVARTTLLTVTLVAAFGGGAVARHGIEHGVETLYRIGGEPVEDRMYDFGVMDGSRLDVKSVTTLDPGAMLEPVFGAAVAAVPPLVIVGDTRTPARIAVMVQLLGAVAALGAVRLGAGAVHRLLGASATRAARRRSPGSRRRACWPAGTRSSSARHRPAPT